MARIGVPEFGVAGDQVEAPWFVSGGRRSFVGAGCRQVDDGVLTGLGVLVPVGGDALLVMVRPTCASRRAVSCSPFSSPPSRQEAQPTFLIAVQGQKLGFDRSPLYGTRSVCVPEHRFVRSERSTERSAGLSCNGG